MKRDGNSSKKKPSKTLNSLYFSTHCSNQPTSKSKYSNSLKSTNISKEFKLSSLLFSPAIPLWQNKNYWKWWTLSIKAHLLKLKSNLFLLLSNSDSNSKELKTYKRKPLNFFIWAAAWFGKNHKNPKNKYHNK